MRGQKKLLGCFLLGGISTHAYTMLYKWRIPKLSPMITRNVSWVIWNFLKPGIIVKIYIWKNSWLVALQDFINSRRLKHFLFCTRRNDVRETFYLIIISSLSLTVQVSSVIFTCMVCLDTAERNQTHLCMQ